MGAIATSLQACHRRIEAACLKAGRSRDEISLLAVSKTFPAAAVRAAWQAGQRAFGESYLQEAVAKLEDLRELPLEWHFIGPIQSNKTRAIAELFQWVHGVDRLKVAERLAEARPADAPPLNVLIQVNVGGEASKHGVAPEAALPLARAVMQLPRLRLRGFMTIPRPSDDPMDERAQFAVMQTILDAARAAGLPLDTLSMGMSDDLEAAILEGSTLVRIGTAIFGKRTTTEP
jgi:pyridoxal phosphate enzyme (YggS family)